jgi:uncharacterized protein YijF (DUF1287 family)
MTRNLQIYLRYHSEVLPEDKEYQPGDIVTMDTGIANGTVFDHIGILDDSLNPQGLPKVINIWTTGYRTASMDLLGHQFPISHAKQPEILYRCIAEYILHLLYHGSCFL